MAPSGFKVLDFYRKIPEDFVKQTSVGASLSLCAGIFMLVLFFIELFAFLSTSTETSVILDTNADTQLRINFNITLMDLHCDYAVVDVYDVLGTNTQNISKNIEKWQLDERGVRRIFSGRNREQKDIAHDTHHPSIEELHMNGVHAIPLDDESFDEFLKEHRFSFVNFYAPWCVWCQRLEPTWEAFAEELERLEGTPDELQVDVARVDCVANREVCMQQRIQAFPTLRLFKDGQIFQPDYKQDRTVAALKQYAQNKLELESRMKDWHPKRVERVQAQNKDHPGCMISGTLDVNRVPGNFHIEARSKSHNLNAAMTNLSHIVNHLSFGSPLLVNQKKKLKKFQEYFSNSAPLDGNAYVNPEYHQVFHHFSKVVSTQYSPPGKFFGKPKNILGYQMLSESQMMHYQEQEVPEAKFSYDLSPMAVVVSTTGRRWYDFVTSLCAIIGGTFTVVGLLDSIIHKLAKGDKGL